MNNMGTERVREYLQRSSNISAALLEPEDHVSRGLAHFSLGDYEAALDEFSSALAQRPTYVPAQFNLAVALLRLGRFQEAEVALKAAIGLAAAQDVLLTDAHHYLAAALRAQGRYQEALAEAETATERGGDPAYMYLRAQLHALLGERDNAVHWLRRAIGNRAVYKERARSEPAFESMLSDQTMRDLLFDKSA